MWKIIGYTGSLTLFLGHSIMNDMNDKIESNSHAASEVKLPEISERDYKEENRFIEFIKDFIAGVGSLVAIGLVLFIIIPLLLLIFKVSIALIIPISLFGAVIILIALFGKLVRHIMKR